MQGYRDLAAWKKAMEMVLAVYEVSRQWPDAQRRCEAEFAAHDGFSHHSAAPDVPVSMVALDG